MSMGGLWRIVIEVVLARCMKDDNFNIRYDVEEQANSSERVLKVLQSRCKAQGLTSYIVDTMNSRGFQEDINHNFANRPGLMSAVHNVRIRVQVAATITSFCG